MQPHHTGSKHCHHHTAWHTLKGVNLKSGRYFLNLALEAVFLYCPSALVVSNFTSPCKQTAHSHGISSTPGR